tara:strand:+ start:1823 stop:2572 length:750 start_codon:yes stop_codon:yes gene_type:complete
MKDINVLIPYKNRSKDLERLLPTVRKSLKLLGLKPFFIISEQADDNSFNRGAIFNAGFKEGSRITDCNYWIFHDVDVFEIKAGSLGYFQANGAAGIFCHDINSSPGGGVMCINSESFKKANGYTNQFWLWGLEDTDFRKRIIARKIPILNPENVVYKSQKKWQKLVHHSASPKSDNREKKIDKNQCKLHHIFLKKYKNNPSSVMDDGLNNIKYKLVNKQIIESDVVKLSFHISPSDHNMLEQIDKEKDE